MKQFLQIEFSTKDLGRLRYFLGIEDISFVVGVVSQFMTAHRTPHWDVLQIVTYLKNAPGHGLLFKNHKHLQVMSHSDGDKNGALQMVGYSYADWVGCPTDRRSISGYCVFVGGNLVSWKSKRQSLASRSSAEAEYRTMAHVGELTWVRMLLAEISFTAPQMASLHCNNQSAIHITTNPVFHEHTKHIEMDCHFIREKVKHEEIALHHTRSED
ncbi:hypothetical protein CFOL_v3_08691 [Cephalotus follicularis]|uniref:RVT_2 domain-containing protein n=1 Tax=Cephalotus follicularis TaxID=3775 RepID=A0A1Q3BAW3_CEPFO|nr:hypothetical protein CFOL_v3_08691 [Cephalotus follicularis]